MNRALSIRDLHFRQVVLRCTAPDGHPFIRLARVGMPKLPPNVIKCVFYLYRTPEDARAGTDPHGTGFLVSVPIGRLRGGALDSHLYAVANWHVVADESDKDDPPCPVIRLNGKDGTPIVVPLTVADWLYISGGVDVAVAPLEVNDKHDVLSIPVEMFLDADMVDGLIGIGDDVFMMGLFIDHSGGPRNVPAARFGNISMVPSADAPVPQPNLGEGEAFVLDLHSRSGFSGSPAFVYRTFGSDMTADVSDYFHIMNEPRLREPISLRVYDPTVFKFLGIHFAQFPEELEAHDGTPISGLSGMTCAIPAWKILDVLNLPELVAMREEAGEKLKQKMKRRPKPEKGKTTKRPGAPTPDVDADEHKARFNRLLGAAVKRPKSSD